MATVLAERTLNHEVSSPAMRLADRPESGGRGRAVTGTAGTRHADPRPHALAGGTDTAGARLIQTAGGEVLPFPDQAGPSRQTGTGEPARSRPGPDRDRSLRSWPLLILALPATVAVWSGWVGIGQLTGFGEVHPLPGIWDSLHLDTAVTLPVGVEAYAAYALRAWLSASTAVSARTRRFARWSTIGSLVLGMAGQVAYHLLTQARSAHAPWGITTAVSCLPVLVLGMGAALAHMIRADASRNSTTGPASTPPDRGSAGSRKHPDEPSAQQAPERYGQASSPSPDPSRPAHRRRPAGITPHTPDRGPARIERRPRRASPFSPQPTRPGPTKPARRLTLPP